MNAKYIFLSLALMLSFTTAYAQRNSDLVFGKRTGEQIERYANGNIRMKGYYDNDGKMQGKWVFGNEKGVINKETNYLNDEREGEEKLFSDSGQLLQLRTYSKGILHGKSIEYNQSNPKLLSVERNYVNGKLDGTSKFYNAKGQLQREVEFKNDKEISTKYYSDGKPKLLVTYNADGSEKRKNLNTATNNSTKQGTKSASGQTTRKKRQLKESESGVIDFK